MFHVPIVTYFPGKKTEWSCVTSLHLLEDTLIALFCSIGLGKCHLWAGCEGCFGLSVGWAIEAGKMEVQKETKPKKAMRKTCLDLLQLKDVLFSS